MKNTKRLIASLFALAAPMALSPMAFAQTATVASNADDEAIVVLGTRRQNRSVVDSAVAIDVISAETLETTGYADLNDSLRTLVPSFNAQRLPLNDGSSFVRPITLRASPADHVLLLMNGHRRHRSSIVQIGTGHATTSGSQGQDFNVIPGIAVSSVEVLRDGAAAQYGSDAIAGVVNLTLSRASSGGSITGHYGMYGEGDGETFDLQGNIGFGLTDSGFLNLSAQYTNQEKTFRGGPHAGAEVMRANGVQGVPEYPLELGEPSYEALKTSWNAGIELGGGYELYSFGNYMLSTSTVGFSYRQSLAAGPFPAHATYAHSAYDGTPAHPGIFDLTTIYPGGFTPQFRGDQTDFSNVLGLRFNNGDRFSYDLSFRFGQNEVEYTIGNTINPSMGNESPTQFRPGSLQQQETEAVAEFTYKLTPRSLLFGGVSYRLEQYTIGVGDVASYSAGPLIDLPVGSNGFQGFSPSIAGEFDAGSYAAFVEFETDITDRWQFSAAGRYENYEAFGDNFSYKATTRFEINDGLALRGSVSTGFRAPAAGQLFGTSQTSQIDPATSNFILDAVLRPGSPEGLVFGAGSLKPETSQNISAGIVFQTGRFLATLDFYQIEVDDRLLLTPSRNTTLAERNALAALGYPNGAGVQQVRYFQNRLDTRVSGFDFVSTYAHDWGAAGETDFSLAVNHNKQELRSDPTGVYSGAQVIEFEEGTPGWRGSFSATHHIGQFDLMLRGIYYGEWKRLNGASFLDRDAEILWDAEVTYRLSDNTQFAVGGRNITDVLPPGRGPGPAASGIIYDNHNPYGLSGSYFYVNVRQRF